MSDEIEALKTRIAELELQLSIYEGVAGTDWFLPGPDAVGLRLTGQERQILHCLYERRGKNVLTHALERAASLAGRGEDVLANTMKVRICKLRQKLGRTSWRIVGEWGLGYRLERLEQQQEKAA